MLVWPSPLKCSKNSVWNWSTSVGDHNQNALYWSATERGHSCRRYTGYNRMQWELFELCLKVYVQKSFLESSSFSGNTHIKWKYSWVYVLELGIWDFFFVELHGEWLKTKSMVYSQKPCFCLLWKGLLSSRMITQSSKTRWVLLNDTSKALMLQAFCGTVG